MAAKTLNFGDPWRSIDFSLDSLGAAFYLL